MTHLREITTRGFSDGSEGSTFERAAVEEREADETAIDTAVQTFRYDHDLITAEETESWLAQRGLTLSDFSDYFTRHYWAEAMGAEVKGGFVGYFSAESELRDVFLAELIFSGELGRMATRLTWRLAAAAGGKTMPGAGRGLRSSGIALACLEGFEPPTC